MGFSPGDFTTEDGDELHLELKDNARVVLWSHDELNKIFVLKLDEAYKLYEQLYTLLALANAL